MELHWKFCITCRTRHEPAAFIRIAQIDTVLTEVEGWPAASLTDPPTQTRIVEHYQSERERILGRLQPASQTAPQPPTGLSTDTAPQGVPRLPVEPGPPEALPAPSFSGPRPFTPPQPPPPRPFSPPPAPSKTLLERLADPATLKLMIYGGSLLMTIGALIYLRDLIATQLQKPVVQAGLLALVTAVTYGAGLWLIKRTKAELIGRGLLLIGALMMPLNPWFLVHSGILPRGENGWAVGFVCAAVYMGTAVLLQETMLLYLAIPAALLSGIGFLDRILHASPEGFVFFSAIYGTALFAHSHLRKTSFAAPVTAGFGQVILSGSALFALGLHHSALSILTALMCLGVGHFVPRYGLGLFHLFSGYVLFTAGYIERLDRTGILNSRWAMLSLTAWLLVFFCALELAEKIETARKADARWSFSLKMVEWAYAGPFLIGCAITVVVFATVPAFVVKPGESLRTLTHGISRETFAVCLATLPLMVWSLRRMLKTHSAWYAEALAVTLYAGCGIALIALGLGGMAVTLILLTFTIGLRAAVEVWGANLGNQFGTSPDTHFGVDFGIPSRPETEPFRVTTNIFAALTGLAVVTASFAEIFHPLQPLAQGLIGLFFLGGGFVAGGNKRATAAYAGAGVALYAGIFCALHGNLHLDLYWTGAGLAVAALIGYFLSRPTETSVSETLGSALLGVTVSLLTVLVMASLPEFAEWPGRRPETFIVFACATLAAGHATFRRRREFGYAAAVCGALAFTRLLQIAHLPNREFPTAFVIFGFTLLLVGLRVLPRYETDLPEDERRSPVFIHCGDFLTIGGLIGVAILGIELPLGTVDRLRHLAGMGLGIVVGATVSAIGRDRAHRTFHAAVGLLFGFLTYVESLRVADLPERHFPTATLLFGFAVLVLGIQVLSKRRMADPEAPPLDLLFTIGGHLVTGLSMAGVTILALDLPEARAERITLLAGIGFALGAAVTIGTVARESLTRNFYSLAGMFFAVLFYVRTLNVYGYSVLADIELLTLPLGAMMMVTGWLKNRGRDGENGFGTAFIWLGSILFCVPVMLHAFQVRFDSGTSWRLDILTDSAALAALTLGWWLRQRGPVVFGGCVLGTHLAVVILDSVKWGQVPYAVYLFGIGSTSFLIGAGVWYLSRNPELLQRVGSGLRAGWHSRFAPRPKER